MQKLLADRVAVPTPTPSSTDNIIPAQPAAVNPVPSVTPFAPLPQHVNITLPPLPSTVTRPSIPVGPILGSGPNNNASGDRPFTIDQSRVAPQHEANTSNNHLIYDHNMIANTRLSNNHLIYDHNMITNSSGPGAPIYSPNTNPSLALTISGQDPRAHPVSDQALAHLRQHTTTMATSNISGPGTGLGGPGPGDLSTLVSMIPSVLSNQHQYLMSQSNAFTKIASANDKLATRILYDSPHNVNIGQGYTCTYISRTLLRIV